MPVNNPYYDPRWGSQNVSGFGDSSDYTDQPNSAGMDYGGAANGAMAGYSSGQAFGNPNGFQMSDANVWGGVASGAASGAATGGPVGGFIGAVTGGITSVTKQDKALRESTNNVNTTFNSYSDAYGRPVYDSQGISQGQQDFRGLMKATQPGKNAMLPKRRRQMLRKAENLYYNMQTAQNNFNRAELDWREQSMAQQDYRRRLNDNSGMYNVYRSRY